MNVTNGRWVCDWCGAVIDVRPRKSWSVEFRRGEAGELVRVLVIDQQDEHRCQCPTATADTPPLPMWLAS